MFAKGTGSRHLVPKSGARDPPPDPLPDGAPEGAIGASERTMGRFSTGGGTGCNYRPAANRRSRRRTAPSTARSTAMRFDAISSRFAAVAASASTVTRRPICSSDDAIDDSSDISDGSGSWDAIWSSSPTRVPHRQRARWHVRARKGQRTGVSAAVTAITCVEALFALTIAEWIPGR